MGLFYGIIAFAIAIVAYFVNSKFEDKIREISDLKDELRKAERSLELVTSSKEWLECAYEDLAEKYEMLLGRYNPPPRWWEDEDGKDEEDEQTVEIFIKGKDGTRAEKVPAKYISFKEGGNK